MSRKSKRRRQREGQAPMVGAAPAAVDPASFARRGALATISGVAAGVARSIADTITDVVSGGGA
ncbi:hypothetical protein ABT160_43655 [Streptomyces sp. NPDC001941]|uniref:hypothetical protein n=1 Tax=Streptomyces sp. NPDC001941 TaxID=3154659 RepID=UPI003320F163